MTDDTIIPTVDAAESTTTVTDAPGVDLPPPNTKRWVVRRKAAVVQAVRAGVMSLDDACKRYNLSTEEFMSWQRLIDRHGVRGLRITRLQDYRSSGAV